MNIVAFLILRSFISFCVSELFILLKKDSQDYLVYYWLTICLGDVFSCQLLSFKMSLFSCITYRFSLIFRLLVAIIKTFFSSPDTKCFSDIIFSFSTTRLMFILIFCFLTIRIIYFSNTFTIRDFYWIYFVQICFAFLFIELNTIISLFLIFLWSPWFLFVKYSFSEYNFLLTDLLSPFVLFAWIARINLSLENNVLLKLIKTYTLKEA